MYYNKDYWKNYMERWFGNELIEKWEEHVVIKELMSKSRKSSLAYAAACESSILML